MNRRKGETLSDFKERERAYNASPQRRASAAARRQSPAGRAAQRELDSRPYRKARKAAAVATPAGRARRLTALVKFRAKPGQKEKQAIYDAKKYQEPEYQRKLRNVLDSPEHKDMVTEQYLLRKYGMTLEQRIEMLAAQGGLCAICGTELVLSLIWVHNRACIDHDHVTNVVRAILCEWCNKMIACEEPALLRQAAIYLEHFAKLKLPSIVPGPPIVKTKFTPALKRKILREFRQGATIAAACFATGITRRTFYNFCQEYPEFQVAAKLARAA